MVGNYKEAFDLALALSQTYRAEVTLLHVLDRKNAGGINPNRTVDWAKHALEALAPDGLSLVPPVHTRVTTGALAEEIVKAADQTEADWIVLGAEGGNRFSAFQEHPAYQVERLVPCSRFVMSRIVLPRCSGRKYTSLFPCETVTAETQWACHFQS
jgi:nucleotide-binding universal stress UspA family protein